jgi:hypothetical protein
MGEDDIIFTTLDINMSYMWLHVDEDVVFKDLN